MRSDTNNDGQEDNLINQVSMRENKIEKKMRIKEEQVRKSATQLAN